MNNTSIVRGQDRQRYMPIDMQYKDFPRPSYFCYVTLDVFVKLAFTIYHTCMRSDPHTVIQLGPLWLAGLRLWHGSIIAYRSPCGVWLLIHIISINDDLHVFNTSIWMWLPTYARHSSCFICIFLWSVVLYTLNPLINQVYRLIDIF